MLLHTCLRGAMPTNSPWIHRLDRPSFCHFPNTHICREQPSWRHWCCRHLYHSNASSISYSQLQYIVIHSPFSGSYKTGHKSPVTSIFVFNFLWNYCTYTTLAPLGLGFQFLLNDKLVLINIHKIIVQKMCSIPHTRELLSLLMFIRFFFIIIFLFTFPNMDIFILHCAFTLHCITHLQYIA